MVRQQRLSSVLQAEISMLLRKKINDDRIGFITLTGVKVSKDMAHAWVYYSQIGSEEDKERTKKGLASATKFFHSELSKAIRYMAVPKLHFRFDDTLEKGVDLVNKLHKL